MKKKKLGEVLRDRGHISPADLHRIVGEQQGKVIHLGELMLERGLVGKEDLGAALEEVSHIPYIDCSTIQPELEAMKLVPRAMAERLCVLPLRMEQKQLVVIMAAPQDLAVLDELRFKAGKEISPRLSFRGELQHAIESHYSVVEGPSSSYGTVSGGKDQNLRRWNSFPPVRGRPIRRQYRKYRPICGRKKRRQFGWFPKCFKWPWPRGPAIFTSSRVPRTPWCACEWTGCCTITNCCRGRCKIR